MAKGSGRFCEGDFHDALEYIAEESSPSIIIRGVEYNYANKVELVASIAEFNKVIANNEAQQLQEIISMFSSINFRHVKKITEDRRFTRVCEYLENKHPEKATLLRSIIDHHFQCLRQATFRAKFQEAYSETTDDMKATVEMGVDFLASGFRKLDAGLECVESYVLDIVKQNWPRLRKEMQEETANEYLIQLLFHGHVPG